jgi:undecaprenyl-diphosphatase
MLENVVVVAISLLVGGIILVFIDRIANDNTRDREISYFDALKIGFFQCIAMIPGVSRSASTIIGGMLQGLSRKQAAEFSFFPGCSDYGCGRRVQVAQNLRYHSGRRH